MNTKLTLSINQAVIEEAKSYAKKSGKSLSSIVEEYLKSLSNKQKIDKKTESLNIIKELRGSVKIKNKDIDYKEILQDALIEKYLSK